jgi:FkbM family methyltransferase
MAFPYKPYRIGMNLLARSMRALMKARGIDGTFCVGPHGTFYEFEGIRLAYDYAALGVGGNIDAGGTSESATRNKLYEYLHPGAVFYDVGAHDGLFALSAKRKQPRIKVHAFEPQPDALLANLALNGLPDVAVHAVAVGDKPGLVSMTTDQRSSNHVTGDGSIPMIRLDDLDIEPPTIIKMDIEGFEPQALKGAERILSTSRPIVITEINHCLLRYHTDLRDMHDRMSRNGYTMNVLRSGAFAPTSAVALTELPPSDNSNYWWLPH